MSLKDNVVIQVMTCNRRYEKRTENLVERIEEIIGKYEENPTADPDLYEFIEVAADTAKYVDDNTEFYKFNSKVFENELKPVEYKAYRAFKGINKLSKIVLNRLQQNGLANMKDPLYELTAKAWIRTVNYNNYAPISALVDKNIASVGLYIAQLRRRYAKVDELLEKAGIKEEFTTQGNIKLNQTKYDNEKEYGSLEYLMEVIRTREDEVDDSRERIYQTIQKFYETPMSIHNYKDFEFPRFLPKEENKGKRRSLKNENK